MKVQTTKIFSELQKAFDGGYTTASLQGSARCFAPGTLVRMADGRLKPIEHIVVGDKVMSVGGNGYNTITETHSGICEMFRVHQARGIDYTVNSHHILSLKQTETKYKKVAIPGYKSAEKRKLIPIPYDGEKIHDIAISNYIELSKNEKRKLSGFKCSQPLQLKETPLPIDPYYLGLWIGDGSSARPHEITNVDAEVVEYLHAFAESLETELLKIDNVSHRLRIVEPGTHNKRLGGKVREFMDSFRSLGLIGNKHIPDAYLYNSLHNRLELLAGILDADGCCTKRNTLTLVQKNKRIIEAVLELCRTCGLYTNGINTRIAKMKRPDGSVYECQVYGIEINHNTFDQLNQHMKVERKKIYGKNCSRVYGNTSVSVEPIGVGEYYGFSLDNSPHFLLEDGTVVHNSSKTWNTLIWLIIYCLRVPNTTVSIVRATRTALKGSAFRDFKEILINMGVYDDRHMNKTDLEYNFANGSRVEFFGADDEQKLRGRKRNILYVNEANEITFLEWQQLKMRTTLFNIVDYNPSFSDEHWLCSLNAEERTYHFISTYKDNPFLEQVVIDEIESLQHKNKSLWQVYGLGIQAIVEGLVFTNWDTVDEIPPSIERRYGATDWGFANDPTAILEVGIYHDEIYVNEIVYRTAMLTNEIIEVLKSPPLRGLKIISESADPRLVQEIYRAGVNIRPVTKYKGSIEAGITKMQEMKIHVTKNSTNVIKELKNYTYQQDKEGKWLSMPIDKWNHANDAIRYVVLEEVLGGVPKRIDIDRLAKMINR